MSPYPRRRRRVGALRVTVLLVWGAVVVAAYLYRSEVFIPIAVAATAIAVGVRAYLTGRSRKPPRKSLITVKDLRRR